MYILYNQSYFSSKNIIPWEEIQSTMSPVSQSYVSATLSKLDVTRRLSWLNSASQSYALLKDNLTVQELNVLQEKKKK